MPDWKKIPAMFADAIKRSEYGTDCYVKDYTVERAQNETGAVEARISVQSNKSIQHRNLLHMMLQETLLDNIIN